MRGKSNWPMHRVRYYKSNAFWTPYSVYKLQRTFDNAAHKAVGKVLCRGRGPHLITALFNNMRTLKFKGQPTNAFSLTTIKCSAGPPSLRLLPSSVSLSEQCTTIRLPHARQSAVGSWEEPPNIWLTISKNTFVGWLWRLVVEKSSNKVRAATSTLPTA